MNNQAEFYHQAKKAGLNCLFDHKTPRATIAILALNDSGHAISIIHFKPLNKTQQARLNAFLLPIHTITDQTQIHQTIQSIIHTKNQAQSKTLDQLQSIEPFQSPRRSKLQLARLEIALLDSDLNLRPY